MLLDLLFPIIVIAAILLLLRYFSRGSDRGPQGHENRPLSPPFGTRPPR